MKTLKNLIFAEARLAFQTAHRTTDNSGGTGERPAAGPAAGPVRPEVDNTRRRISSADTKVRELLFGDRNFSTDENWEIAEDGKIGEWKRMDLSGLTPEVREKVQTIISNGIDQLKRLFLDLEFDGFTDDDLETFKGAIRGLSAQIQGKRTTMTEEAAAGLRAEVTTVRESRERAFDASKVGGFTRGVLARFEDEFGISHMPAEIADTVKRAIAENMRAIDTGISEKLAKLRQDAARALSTPAEELKKIAEILETVRGELSEPTIREYFEENPDAEKVMLTQRMFGRAVAGLVSKFKDIPDGEKYYAEVLKEDRRLAAKVNRLLKRLARGKADISEAIGLARKMEMAILKKVLLTNFDNLEVEVEGLEKADIEVLFQLYEKGEIDNIADDDARLERIKQLIQAIQRKFPELKIALVSGADASKPRIRKFEYYNSKIEHLKTMLTLADQNPDIRRNKTLIEGMVRALEAGEAEWKKFARANRAALRSAEGPLNALFAYMRQVDTGLTDVEGIDQGVYLETKKTGKMYRFALVMTWGEQIHVERREEEKAGEEAPAEAPGGGDGAGEESPAEAPGGGDGAVEEAPAEAPGGGDGAVEAFTPPVDEPIVPRETADILDDSVEEVVYEDIYERLYRMVDGKPQYSVSESEPFIWHTVEMDTFKILRGIETPSEEYIAKIRREHLSFLKKDSDEFTVTWELSQDDSSGEILFKIDNKNVATYDLIREKIKFENNPALKPEELKEGITDAEIVKVLDAGWTISSVPNSVSNQTEKLINEEYREVLRSILNNDGSLKAGASVDVLVLCFKKIEVGKLGPSKVAIKKELLTKNIARFNLTTHYERLRKYLEAEELLALIFEQNLEVDFDKIKEDVEALRGYVFDKFAAEMTERPEWRKKLKDIDELNKRIAVSLITQGHSKAYMYLAYVKQDSSNKWPVDLTNYKIAEALKEAIETGVAAGEFDKASIALCDELWTPISSMPAVVRAYYEVKKENYNLTLLDSIPKPQEEAFFKKYLELVEFNQLVKTSLDERLTHELIAILKKITTENGNAEALLVELAANSEHVTEANRVDLLKPQYELMLNSGTSAARRLAIAEKLKSEVMEDALKKAIAGDSEKFDRAVGSARFIALFELSRTSRTICDKFLDLDEKDYLKEIKISGDDRAWIYLAEGCKVKRTKPYDKKLLAHISAGHYTALQVEYIIGAIVEDDIGKSNKMSEAQYLELLQAAGLHGKAESYIMEKYAAEPDSPLAKVYLSRLPKNTEKRMEMLKNAYRSIAAIDSSATDQDKLIVIRACLEAGIKRVRITMANGTGTVQDIEEDPDSPLQLIASANQSGRDQLEAKLILAERELIQCTADGKKEECEKGELAVEMAAYMGEALNLKENHYEMIRRAVKIINPSTDLNNDAQKKAYVILLYILATKEDASVEDKRKFIKLDAAWVTDEDVEIAYKRLKTEVALAAPGTGSEERKAYVEAVIRKGVFANDNEALIAAKYCDQSQIDKLIEMTTNNELKVKMYLEAYKGEINGNIESTILKAAEIAKGGTIGETFVRRLVDVLKNTHSGVAFDLMSKYSAAFSVDEMIDFLVEKEVSVSGEKLAKIIAQGLELIEEEEDKKKLTDRLDKIIEGRSDTSLMNMSKKLRAQYFLIAVEINRESDNAIKKYGEALGFKDKGSAVRVIVRSICKRFISGA